MPFGGEDDFEQFVERENLNGNRERRIRYFDTIISHITVQKATGQFDKQMWRTTFDKIGCLGWEFSNKQAALLREIDEGCFEMYQDLIADRNDDDIIEADDNGEIPVKYNGPSFSELTGRGYR